MTLLDTMTKDPSKYEVTEFRKFLARLMRLHNQLDVTYHTDQFLRDRLVTAVNIPQMQSSLRDHLPRSNQKEINRTSSELSNEKRLGGKNSACLIDTDEDEEMYSLGRRYGGDERQNSKEPSMNRTSGGRNNNNRPRRLNRDWMKGEKDCFLCGGDHRENTRHKRGKGTSAIDKFKSKHPTALLMVEYFSNDSTWYVQAEL